MPDYDFHQLSAYDLEILTRDILQAHWGVTIESFKSGRDGGIDLRYATGSNKVIVQVKHLLKTGLAGLYRELTKEAEKVRHLRPTRYVVVTSVQLSAANKNKIVKIIGADVLAAADVLGQEDLNNLLEQHPQIEGQHFKLWLASRAVLDRVLHNAAITQSEFKVQQVHQEARRYVQSGAYPKALSMLNDNRVVIIAGPPGVGKSTLANLLLYEHLEKGFQAVLIQRDIEEGKKLFQSGTPQVFYFDDFMGATFLGDRSAAAAGTNDKALLDFISMIRANANARLVLTTREHIYSQAMGSSERLRSSDLDDLRVFLRMPSYSFSQKARILYNHLFFSDLPIDFQEELLRGNFYLRIIKHEKFNPRLIEWLSSFRRLRTVPVEKYRAFVEGLLHDPSEIWRHAYEQEVSDAGRSLLLAIFAKGGKAPGVRLKPSFLSLHEYRARRYNFQTRPEDYSTALREIAGSFIKPYGSQGVEVIDPSVLDLLNAVVRLEPENAVDIAASADDFDAIHQLFSFATSKNGSSVLESLRHRVVQFAPNLALQVQKQRRFQLGKDAWAYRGITFERRLSVLIDMAVTLPSDELASFVDPLFDRLMLEWQTEYAEIVDAVELLNRLKSAPFMSPSQIERMSQATAASLIESVERGCSSEELRELIAILDTSDGSSAAMNAARTGFETFRNDTFRDELSECNSGDQYEGLIGDLTLFREALGVDVDELIEKVEQARSDFESNEEARADQMQDEWKERMYDERADERGVADMFGSLRGDRE